MVSIRWLVFTAILIGMYVIAITCKECSDFKLKYNRLTDCQGQTGTTFIIMTLNNTARTECSKKCSEMDKCILFFYNVETWSCSFHDRTLLDIEMTPDHSSSCYIDENIVESWIVEIRNEIESASCCPLADMVGPTDSLYWSQSTFRREDVIEVRFSSEMYIERIHIYEVYEAGCVSGIQFLTPNGSWYTVFTTQPEVLTTTRVISPDIPMTDFKTSIVRIATGSRGAYNKIDAARVTGRALRRSNNV